MNLANYLNQRGAKSLLAKRLGVSPVSVSQWSASIRPIPAKWCVEIEKATDRAVLCEDMAPEVDWGFIRGTSHLVDR